MCVYTLGIETFSVNHKLTDDGEFYGQLLIQESPQIERCLFSRPRGRNVQSVCARSKLQHNLLRINRCDLRVSVG